MVLHDLRLEHGNQVAQIDHLLINRWMECYVLETPKAKASPALRLFRCAEHLERASYSNRGVNSLVSAYETTLINNELMANNPSGVGS